MSDDDEDVANLQSICEISKDRANELITAARGSLERAIDIYFQQRQQDDPATLSNTKNTNDVIAIEEDDEDNNNNNSIRGNLILSKPSQAKNHQTAVTKARDFARIFGGFQG
jgi:UBA-like domain